MTSARKHPDRAPHRRRASATDRTKNTKSFRVTGSWDKRPDRPAIKVTSDKHERDRVAREMSEQGAYVIVEKHRGHGLWRTLYELDGPALVAERRAAEQEQRRQAAEERHRAEQAEAARLAAAEQSERDRADLARLMVRPPVAREQCGRRDARHVTGAQR
ncbi:hypothetical protein [Streptomyces caeruleatus]|uniref:Uncharacterized protein n=1 Tax=Streptomyces caeruleatus TaxID=661399 RepID=A0A101TPP2_9ACTN|nr:hypothetical protein [Streptomyces caeruleatus]KUN96175.1 hypothetical protein AQJ67_33580 [Streptomyces caeruleatus]